MIFNETFGSRKLDFTARIKRKICPQLHSYYGSRLGLQNQTTLTREYIVFRTRFLVARTSAAEIHLPGNSPTSMHKITIPQLSSYLIINFTRQIGAARQPRQLANCQVKLFLWFDFVICAVQKRKFRQRLNIILFLSAYAFSFLFFLSLFSALHFFSLHGSSESLAFVAVDAKRPPALPQRIMIELVSPIAQNEERDVNKVKTIYYVT